MAGVIYHSASGRCDGTVALVDEDCREEFVGTYCPQCGLRLKMTSMTFRDNEVEYLDWASYNAARRKKNVA